MRSAAGDAMRLERQARGRGARRAAALHVTRVVAAAIAMTAMSVRDAVAEAPALPDEAVAESPIIWLRSGGVEAAIALTPAFRLLEFRTVGEAGLLAPPGAAEVGLRLAKMEPEGDAASGGVGNQPGELVWRDERSAFVRLGAEGGLHYEVELTLSAVEPRLEAVYRLYNDSDAARTFACWSILAFEREGRIVMPFGKADRARRRLVIPVWATWPQPGVAFGRRALVADAGAPLAGHTYKVGVITEDGWIALVRGNRALVTWSAFDAAAIYPEDGANITAFVYDKGDGGRAWAETERVGPLQRVEPGGCAELRETLLLVDLPDEAAEPDGLREQLEGMMEWGGP